MYFRAVIKTYPNLLQELIENCVPFKPSNLREVEQFLISEYAHLVAPAHSEDFSAWVGRLVADFHAGQRLACSIALETYSELIEKPQYVAIFDNMDFSMDGSPVLPFERAIREQVAALHFTSRYGGRPTDEACRYATAMKMRSFFLYYYNIDRRQFRHVTPDELDAGTCTECVDLREGRLNDMTVIPTKNEGGFSRREKWVFQNEEWERLRQTHLHRYKNEAECLADFLGLTDYDDHEVVCLVYPEDFDHPTYQPCAANRDWGSENLYLSFKKHDNFGRTRNRKGNAPETSMKEQVHLPVDDNRYVYEIRYAGKNGSEPVIWDDLEAECLNRCHI